jgi:inositol 1,4,5-triphosphate receptor type 1/inositol 1,4,5-triphosphate receptor type 3
LDLLCRFFRVLQLMCENNNVSMKRFIRQQTDEDDSIKLNSINFIEFTIMQLRLFLKILSKAVIQIPSFILDFIIEIIQLPCVENQRTLCKTTFFEDASYMS